MQPEKAQVDRKTMRAPKPLLDVRITVTSGERAVRTALARMMQALEPLQLDIEESGTVELVLAEALNNIVEHAYPPGDTPGPISLTCVHGCSGLETTIVDSGRPMPNGRTPVGDAVNVDVDLSDLPEGGFGWFLIKDLAKDVVYRRQGSENHLSFRLAVAL